ncbi:hypothetical protein TruAng_003911 [Truncatella angustata]|nr:hypothetical protein TruAng_003911 [Truncatella angustata]
MPSIRPCHFIFNGSTLVRQLETRVKDLEALISIHAPQLSLDGRVPGPLDTASRTEPQPSANRQLDTQEVGASTTHTDRHSPRPRAVTSTFNTPSPSVQSSQIGPEQPLAHEVGLLSLGNAASEPKYLGPSSGFTLARLTYAAISQSQGLPSTAHQSQSYGGTNLLCQQSECVPLPSLAEMRRFVGAYLEVLHPLYPFLQDGKIEQMLEARLQVSGNPTERASLDDAMLFLVAALGARLLEQGRNVNLKSANYFASAMAHVVTIQLQDSIQGVQIMLLLVLASFTFPGGLNAWFLSSTIIASCVDLGLQRRKVPLRHDYQTDPGAEINENISGITFIHCVMKLPDLGREVVEGASSATGQQSFDESVTDCSEVLSCLGKTWSVASDAKERFEKLAALTKSTLITALGNSNTKIGDALAAVGSIINKRGGVTQEPADPLMASGGNADLDTFLGSEFIWEELGDMSTWFDLTWVGDNQNSSNDAR